MMSQEELYEEIDRLKEESVWADAPKSATMARVCFTDENNLICLSVEHTRAPKQTKEEKIVEELCNSAFDVVESLTGHPQAWITKDELKGYLEEAIKRSKE